VGSHPSREGRTAIRLVNFTNRLGQTLSERNFKSRP
jgi:hypothetical protein